MSVESLQFSIRTRQSFGPRRGCLNVSAAWGTEVVQGITAADRETVCVVFGIAAGVGVGAIGTSPAGLIAQTVAVGVITLVRSPPFCGPTPLLHHTNARVKPYRPAKRRFFIRSSRWLNLRQQFGLLPVEFVLRQHAVLAQFVQLSN